MKVRLVLAIGLVIAAALGVLGVLHALAPDAEAIRAALGAELEKLPDDPIPRDRRIEELMADEDYRKHARALWLKLERLHGPAHQAAKADEAARRAVPPFLSRCAGLNGKPADALRALDDEARSLQNEHGASRYGPALVELRARILAATPKPCADLDHFQLQQAAQKERLAGKYSAALARIDDSAAKHPACGEFLARLSQERQAVFPSAAAAAEKLLAQARRDRRPAPIEQALPDFRNLPDAGRLQALLKELRRP